MIGCRYTGAVNAQNVYRTSFVTRKQHNDVTERSSSSSRSSSSADDSGFACQRYYVACQATVLRPLLCDDK